MTKYRGNVTLVANTPSINVAETTPFRDMEKGSLIMAAAIGADQGTIGTPSDITATFQVGRTVLFNGPINKVFADADAVWGRNGVMAADRLFHGPCPVKGTLSLVFTSAAAQDLTWEIGGDLPV